MVPTTLRTKALRANTAKARVVTWALAAHVGLTSVSTASAETTARGSTGAAPAVTLHVGPVSATPAVVPEAVPFLRHALIQANRSGLYPVPPTLVVLGSLTRLELVGSGSSRRLECEVSLVLVERKGGQLRAIATGRATQAGGNASPQQVRRWRREAIEGAAAQAFASLTRMVTASQHASR